MWEYDDPCNTFPTLFFDVIVDAFFVVEVVLQFFVGFNAEDRSYNDNLKSIARRNLMSLELFWFDAATSIPFSFIDLNVYKAMCVEPGVAADLDNSLNDGRAVRAVKILRIMKIFRLLRLIKFVGQVQDYATINLGSTFSKITGILCVILLAIHFFGCAFWKVRSTTNSDEVIDAFLASKGVSRDEEQIVQDLQDIYLLCIYFIFTVFCTVGFGDIYALNSSEMIFCMFLFLSAAVLFGTIISQLNEIVASKTTITKGLDQCLESYLAIRPPLDARTMIDVWGWERFIFYYNQDNAKQKAILQKDLPEHLKLSIAKNIENNLFSKIPFLAGMREMGEVRTLFSAELLLRSTTRVYSAGTIIAESVDSADGLMVITSGKVNVEAPADELDSEEIESAGVGRSGRSLLYIFGRGDSIGGSAIIGDDRWAGSYGVRADFVARTHCTIEFISTSDVQAILEKLEFFQIKCRLLRARDNFRRYQEDLQRQRDFWQRPPSTKTVFMWVLLGRQISQNLETEQYDSILAQSMPASPSSNGDPSTAPERLSWGALSRTKTIRSTTSTPPPTPLSPAVRSVALAKEEEDMIRSLFNLFDTDGQQSLDEEELASAIFAMGLESRDHRKLARSTMDRIDVDGSRTVSLVEFTDLMKAQLQGRDPEEEIRLTFRAFAGSLGAESTWTPSAVRRTSSSLEPSQMQSLGKVTVDRLRRVARRCRVQLSEKELRGMLDGAERSPGQGVGEAEYVHIMKFSTWF